MKLLITLILMFITSALYAESWKIKSVAKSNAVGTKMGATDQYLHIHIEADKNVKNEKFKIVHTDGREYLAYDNELYWQNDELVFDGVWPTLEGLWLEGNGHKEPLFPTAKLEVVVTAEVEKPSRIIYKNGDRVQIDYADVTKEKIVPIVRSGNTTIVRENPNTIIIKQGTGSGGGSGSGNGSGENPGPGPGEDCDDNKGPGPGPGPSGEAKGEETGTGKGEGSGSGKGEDCDKGPGPGPGPGKEVVSITKDLTPKDKTPDFVLYIATESEDNKGKLYQVDSNGRVLGVVSLPGNPGGVALRRDNGVVVTIPADGGKVVMVNESGKTSVILDKDKNIVHPVAVAIPAQSDAVLLADNIADIFGSTTTEGGKTEICGKEEYIKDYSVQHMSVAIGGDKSILYGTDANKGIFRNKTKILPDAGSVAADNKSDQWAATQDNKVFVFEGDEIIKSLNLPANKTHYRGGMLSFSPAKTLCVAAGNENPWLFMYDLESDKVRSLFPWEREPMTGFVVGPRMRWEFNKK